jgi:hypothetical protein
LGQFTLDNELEKGKGFAASGTGFSNESSRDMINTKTRLYISMEE